MVILSAVGRRVLFRANITAGTTWDSFPHINTFMPQTAQSALHFPPLADLFIPTPFSASLGSILVMQQLRNDYSLTFPPLSIARYSFIQLSRLRRREVKENAQTSKRYQRGFEPGLSRLRVRHSTTEPPRSTS